MPTHVIPSATYPVGDTIAGEVGTTPANRWVRVSLSRDAWPDVPTVGKVQLLVSVDNGQTWTQARRIGLPGGIVPLLDADGNSLGGEDPTTWFTFNVKELQRGCDLRGVIQAVVPFTTEITIEVQNGPF